jgi:hypothetical protein
MSMVKSNSNFFIALSNSKERKEKAKKPASVMFH